MSRKHAKQQKPETGIEISSTCIEEKNLLHSCIEETLKNLRFLLKKRFNSL